MSTRGTFQPAEVTFPVTNGQAGGMAAPGRHIWQEVALHRQPPVVQGRPAAVPQRLAEAAAGQRGLGRAPGRQQETEEPLSTGVTPLPGQPRPLL